jgi:hypothetical protein
MRRLMLRGMLTCMVLAATPAFAQDITLTTNASGITIGGSPGAWSTGFGSVNGLGVGTPGTGQTILSATGGKLYSSPYDIVITGSTGAIKAVVKAYVSTTFGHSAILQVYSCLSNCGNAANYTAMSTNAGSPTDIVPFPGQHNSTVTARLAVFVSSQNGASAFTGTDSATITLLVSNGNGPTVHTYTLSLNNPNENVQTAVSLSVAAAAGGRTISAGSDFSLSYGTVNGLGISPGVGLTATSVSGGQLYSTPYLLQPSFSSFSSTTGTLTGYVSTDFAHPSQLELRDSIDGSSFSAISKSSGTQTTFTSSATSTATVTRYLGLFVGGTNGASVFTGADNATVTYTLVVP